MDRPNALLGVTIPFQSGLQFGARASTRPVQPRIGYRSPLKSRTVPDRFRVNSAFRTSKTSLIQRESNDSLTELDLYKLARTIRKPWVFNLALGILPASYLGVTKAFPFYHNAWFQDFSLLNFGWVLLGALAFGLPLVLGLGTLFALNVAVAKKYLSLPITTNGAGQ